MTHKKIKRYQIDGQLASDADILRIQAQYVNMLYYDMRGQGFVPVLDLSPAWSTSWDGDKYSFLLTVHGVYLGKARAKKVYGVIGQKEIPME